MSTKQPDDSRIVSVCLPDDLLQRLDRYLDWSATHQGLQSTRNAARREVLSAWRDQQEQLAGLLEPQALRRQFQATYNSIHHSQAGVPIHRLRQVLRWPRERFDAVLEALRADHQVDLEVLKENALASQAPQDSYHVHGQLYIRIRWRDGGWVARPASAPSPKRSAALAVPLQPRYHSLPLYPITTARATTPVHPCPR